MKLFETHMSGQRQPRDTESAHRCSSGGSLPPRLHPGILGRQRPPAPQGPGSEQGRPLPCWSDQTPVEAPGLPLKGRVVKEK